MSTLEGRLRARLMLRVEEMMREFTDATAMARSDCEDQLALAMPRAAPVESSLTCRKIRRLRCAAQCIESRCDQAALRYREGFAVCRQHHINKKFRPHATAIRMPESEFCVFTNGFVKDDDT